MSRIGKMPITVPAGVKVEIDESNFVTVTGPKGTLSGQLNSEMVIKRDGDTITVERPSDDRIHRSLHGLTRTLLANMVNGTDKGFSKELEVNGVGYRAAKEGKTLVMNLGYSHPIKVDEIDGITIDVPAPNKIVISGLSCCVRVPFGPLTVTRLPSPSVTVTPAGTATGILPIRLIVLCPPYHTNARTSPPTWLARAALSVMTPLDVETMAMPRPRSTRGSSSAPT